MKNIYLVNGPNLNLLGSRETDIYGSSDLSSIEKKLIAAAKEKNTILHCFQSNDEGDIVSYIHNIPESSCLIINAAAYTHTSVAIRDAILAKRLRTVEVHLSNIYTREEFRHHSYLRDIVLGIIMGFGEQSYHLALQYFLNDNSK